jgi:parallel beta-helix repeat protein
MRKKSVLLYKTLVVGIIILFVGIGIRPIIGFENPINLTSKVNILYVGGSGEGNYTRIQDAIDNASDGDTVFVYDDSSPYYDNVTIDKQIQLIGENKDTTIMDAQKKGSVIFIINNSVTVTGFTLQNSGDEFYNGGVEIRSNHNLITENIIIFNKIGVSIKDCEENTVSKNIIRNNTEGVHPNIYYGGIFIKNSNYNLIIENIIKNNDHPGLILWDSKENEIIGNIIAYNIRSGIDIWGISTDYNTISRNILKNNMGHGIDVERGSDNVISFNNFENETIYLFCSENTLIYKNNFFNSGATFDYYIGDKPINIWIRNYWNRPRFLPKIIIGVIGTFQEWDFIPLFPWLNIDFLPAKEPYYLS